MWIAALAGFLAYYLLTVGHEFAHPVHWGLAGFGALIGITALKLWYSPKLNAMNTSPASLGRWLAFGLIVVAAIVAMALTYS